MTVDRVELRRISKTIVPDSLKWDVFASKYLGEIDPYFHGNIAFAFSIAEQAHKNQSRESGEPYFSHCLMTAIYLIEAGCDHPPHIQAGFLHDVPEDNLDFLLRAQRIIVREYQRIGRENEIFEIYEGGLLARFFDPETAEIIEAVTKPGLRPRTAKGKEKFEKNCQKDILNGPPGAWVLKGFDRLHNLRTMQTFDPARIVRKIIETRRWYLPIFEKAAQAFPLEGAVLLREINEELATLEESVSS